MRKARMARLGFFFLWVVFFWGGERPCQANFFNHLIYKKGLSVSKKESSQQPKKKNSKKERERVKEKEREVEMNQGGDQGRNGPQNQRPGNVRPGTGPDFGNLPPQRGKIIRQVVADFAADVSNVLNATIPYGRIRSNN